MKFTSNVNMQRTSPPAPISGRSLRPSTGLAGAGAGRCRRPGSLRRGPGDRRWPTRRFGRWGRVSSRGRPL